MRIKKNKLKESRYIVDPESYDKIKDELEDDDVVKVVDEDIEEPEVEDPKKVKPIITKDDLIEIVTNKNKKLTESRIIYDENHKETIHPKLASQLRNREHSLGKHPAFPESNDHHFEENLISKRFTGLVKNYKKQFDVSDIQEIDVLTNTMLHFKQSIQLEEGHQDALVKLAIKLVREEFDVSEEDVIIEAELTTNIDSSSITKNARPVNVEGIEFEDHHGIENANKEVYKRRLVNAMIQGSAKKCSHLFHMVEDEISDLNPRLNTNYSKLMAGADYMYFTVDDSAVKSVGGIVEVTFPKNEDEPSKIEAKAVCFPVLVHELVKGVMELLSSHGLPEDKKLTEYIMGKADFSLAEPWDMRLGPVIWEQFMNMVDTEDFDLKHYIYAELISLPVDEFNDVMREILAGTKKGKTAIDRMVVGIREDLQNDEYDDVVNTTSDDSDDDLGFGDSDSDLGLDDIDFDFLR